MQPPESSKFKILDPLGEGAMGIVYRAVHEASGRTVALKFLRQSLYDDELVSSRFARELEICRKLDHPNIVAILEIGEEHGRSYLAMELLEAETMEERLKAMGPRPVDEIVRMLVQVLSALEYLHERELLHRDLKPANIMWDRKGRVTLMDFGLVKDSKRTALTETGFLVGSPAYLCPEVIRGDLVDGRSDLFALATVSYELLSGSKPFKGNGLEDLLLSINRDTAVPLSDLVADCPRSLAHFVEKCHAKDPQKRFFSAREARDFVEVIEESLLSHKRRLDRLPDPPSPAREERGPQEQVPIRLSLRSQRRRIESVSPPPWHRGLWRPGPRLSGLIGATLVVSGLTGLAISLRAVELPHLLSRLVGGGARIEGLVWESGVDEVRASWNDDERAEARFEIVGLDALNAQQKIESRSVGSRGRFEAQVDGLSPGRRYRLRVLDSGGREIHRVEIQTREAREFVATLADRLERLDPRVRSETPVTAEANRVLLDDLGAMNLVRDLRALARIRSVFSRDRGMPPDVLSRLLTGLWFLFDRVVMSHESPELESLSQMLVQILDSSKDAPLPDAQRVCIRFGTTGVSGTLGVEDPAPECLLDSFDGLLSAGARSSEFMSLVTDSDQLRYRLDRSIELPPRALISDARIQFFCHSTAGEGRVVIRASSDQQTYRLLAVFRLGESGLDSGYCRVPPVLLGEGRLWFEIELIPSLGRGGAVSLEVDRLDILYTLQS